jgi:hypothetical protein
METKGIWIQGKLAQQQIYSKRPVTTKIKQTITGSITQGVPSSHMASLYPLSQQFHPDQH